MADRFRWFATTAKGMEAVLAHELQALGADAVEPGRAGVGFTGTLELAYRACLWLRTANRVLLPVTSFSAPNPDALYAGVRALPWREHVGAGRTIAVDFVSSNSAIAHAHFGALKTKDAIVDRLRDETGSRPSVAVERPDVRVNVYLHDDEAVLSIDFSGESLHRRSYRQEAGIAPLKETVAAAALLLAEWPRRADAGVPLIDPMCGAGTIPIEAGLMATNIAPGRGRTYFGFLGWGGHEAEIWRRLLEEAQAVEIRDPRRLPAIRGYDADARVVRGALTNVERAGLRGRVHIEKRSLDACGPCTAARDADVRGVVITNPPYGVRLGDSAALGELYAALGDKLRREFPGWVGYVLSGNPGLSKRIGLRPSRRHILYNGAIECRLLAFPISTTPVRDVRRPRWREQSTPAPTANGRHGVALPGRRGL